MLRITLDSNVVLELMKQQRKAHVVEQLLEQSRTGVIELAVTACIREDIPRDPLASRLSELPELGITETGSVTRLGHWVLGRDMLGSESFSEFARTAPALARGRIPKKKREPDWRDFDHLHAHMLQERDLFLTWDEGVLCLGPELRERFGIRVMSPDDYLKSLAA